MKPLFCKTLGNWSPSSCKRLKASFFALHEFFWDKKFLSLIVIASTFMVRGNPYPVIFRSRTAEETDRRGRRYASLAMTPLLPTFDYPTKIREEPIFLTFFRFA